MKGAQRSISWEHLECLNNAPLGDGQSKVEEAGMATEYLSVKHTASVSESTILLQSIEVGWFGMLLLVLLSHFVVKLKGSF